MFTGPNVTPTHYYPITLVTPTISTPNNLNLNK